MARSSASEGTNPVAEVVASILRCGPTQLFWRSVIWTWYCCAPSTGVHWRFRSSVVAPKAGEVSAAAPQALVKVDATVQGPGLSLGSRARTRQL